MSAPGPHLSPQARIALFYSTIFMSNGVANTFLGIWFKELGLDESQIGLINAAPVFTMMALNLWIGRIADRASDWRGTIIVAALVAGIVPFGLVFSASFWPILAVWAVAGVGRMAVIPVLDAATIRLARRSGFDYSFVRAWGTAGYLAVILITGYLVTYLGPQAFLPFFLFVGLLRAVASLGLPRFRGAERGAPGPGATRLLQVMRPWFLLPLLAWAMVLGTHLILDAFQGLLWKQQGIPEHMIGILIALGAAAETAMFFLFRRTAARIPARWLILASAAVAALRWAAMGLSPPVAVLIPMQLLHSITYALGFLGCVTFIANHTSEGIAAEAQSFSTLLQQGCAVITLTGFGWLATVYGAQAYFGSAIFAGLGALMVWISLRMHQPATPSA